MADPTPSWSEMCDPGAALFLPSLFSGITAQVNMTIDIWYNTLCQFLYGEGCHGIVRCQKTRFFCPPGTGGEEKRIKNSWVFKHFFFILTMLLFCEINCSGEERGFVSQQYSEKLITLLSPFLRSKLETIDYTEQWTLKWWLFSVDACARDFSFFVDFDRCGVNQFYVLVSEKKK